MSEGFDELVTACTYDRGRESGVSAVESNREKQPKRELRAEAHMRRSWLVGWKSSTHARASGFGRQAA